MGIIAILIFVHIKGTTIYEILRTEPGVSVSYCDYLGVYLDFAVLLFLVKLEAGAVFR